MIITVWIVAVSVAGYGEWPLWNVERRGDGLIGYSFNESCNLDEKDARWEGRENEKSWERK